MHEHGPISAALSSLGELDRRTPVGRVEVALGPSMDPSVARAAWSHMIEGTPLQGVEVVWTETADLLTCLACFADYRGGKVATCPECGGDGLVVEPAVDVDVRVMEGAD